MTLCRICGSTVLIPNEDSHPTCHSEEFGTRTRSELARLAKVTGRRAMAGALEANPEQAARVEAAIRQLAATGRPFSANDARAIHGVRGGVVGATFNSLKGRVIKPLGESETSTDRGTHGKSVALWVAA